MWFDKPNNGGADGDDLRTDDDAARVLFLLPPESQRLLDGVRRAHRVGAEDIKSVGLISRPRYLVRTVSRRASKGLCR